MDSFDDTRRRRSTVMLITGVILIVIAVATVVIAVSGAAHGSPLPSQSAATATQKPGGECTTAGATFARHGRIYECVQKPWDGCLRWHDQKPAGYHPPASWTRPAQRPCEGCTPTPSTPAVTTPAVTTPPATPAPSAPPSQPAGLPHPADSTTPPATATVPTLPVTGSPVAWIVAVGLLFVVGGVLLRFYRRSIREGDPHEQAIR